jgi:hypothetical protein
MRHSAFYKFVQEQNLKCLSPEQLEKLQYEFLKSNKIKYLILANNTPLPDIYKADVDTFVYDKVSGKSFVFLK